MIRAPKRQLDFPLGGGEMGSLIAAHDWSRSPLGPLPSWPPSLRTSLNTCLNSRFAILIWWGPDLVMLYNDAYREIIGSKHPAALGMPGRNCFPEVWPTIGPMLESVMVRGEATRSDDLPLFLERHGYPEECYFTFSYSPIRDESGQVVGVFTPVAETTEKVIGARRLQTLQELASRSRSARDVRSVCGSAAETLAANTTDIPFSLTYVYTGPGEAAELVARSGSGWEGPDFPDALVFQDRPDSILGRAVKSGHTEQISRGETPAWPFTVDTILVLPLLAASESLPAGFLIAGVSPCKRLDTAYRTFFELAAGQIAAAIAEARAYEQERKRAEALAELDRAKTIFFNNISHEFRTPLTLMLGPIQNALEQGDGEAAIGRGELELLQRNGLRLLKLVNALLDFARIQAGRVRAWYALTDMGALTLDLASSFRSAAEKAGLRFRVECTPGEVWAYLDRDLWEKVVLNLLSNALKFTLEGEISVSVRQTERAAELAVRDTGIGIPEEDLPRIFDRFHRVESARGRTHEGTGIGLALVEELVKLHGGSVTVRSEAGRGTKFTVSVPLGTGHLPPERLRAYPSGSGTATGALPYIEEALHWHAERGETSEETLAAAWESSGKASGAAEIAGRPRILIADDNADMREYVRRLLRERYTVECTRDGLTALADAKRHRPDLVLTDVMMPGLDGFGLLRALRADPLTATTPVILLSARAGEEARIEGLEAGADDYLVKPFGARELLARVASCLEIARLRQEAERKERELRVAAESERRRWHQMLRQSPALVAVLRGPDHIFELANAAYLSTIGRAREEEVLGKPVAEVLPELGAQGFLNLLDEVYRSGVPYRADERLAKLDRAHNGVLEDRYFDFVYQPYRDAHGTIEAILVHAVDVTEPVTARRRIEESERQLRTLADSMPQLVWMADSSGRRFWFNRRWYEYTGSTPLEAEGWGWQNVLHPDHLARVSGHLRRSFEAGEVWEDTYPLRRADGTYRWFLSRATPLRNSEGLPVCWFGTNTDITLQIEGEGRLRESEEAAKNRASELQAIMDAVPAAILIARDSACRELIGNRAAHALMPWRFSENRREELRLAKDGAEIDFDELPLQVAARSLRPVKDYEFEVRAGDAAHQCLLCNAVPLLDDAGTGRGAVAAIMDVTERKRIEERLRDAQRFESIGLLAGGIAHDFNNLLVPTLANASLIREMLGPRHRATALLADIEAASERGAHLTRQMLAYAGKSQFLLEPVDVSAAVRDAVDLIRASLPTGVSVRLNLHAGLPSIEIDRREINQLLINILTNSAEAIGHDTGSIVVDTELVRTADPTPYDLLGLGEMAAGTYVALKISDTGRGMDAATRAKMFEPFFSTKFAGRGLGLAAVAGIVRAHKGGVRVTTSPGRGCTIEVIFPAAERVSREVESHGTPIQAGSPRASILVIDDEEMVRRVARISLEREGHTVQVAESGRAAISIFQAKWREIDVVLLDLSMPGMNGQETLVALRALDPDVKAVISSGYSEAETMRNFPGQKIYGFVQKPYKPAQLVALIKLALKKGSGDD